MKDICIIDKIMRGTIIFWLTKIFLLAGSTWSAWELETDGCRRITMLVMQTSSIRWKLDSKKESNIKSNFLQMPGGTHGRAGSRLLSCSRANHPRSHRCGQFVSGGKNTNCIHIHLIFNSLTSSQHAIQKLIEIDAGTKLGNRGTTSSDTS